MNRNERRARAREQARTAAALRKRASGPIGAIEAYQISQRLFQLGKVKQALPGLLAAVAAHPTDPDLQGALAYALASAGQVERAIDAYREVLRVRPESVSAMTNLAFLLMQIGDWGGALERLERASELAPGHANTAFILAELLGQLNRKEEAFHHYRRAVLLFQKKIGDKPDIRYCDDLVKLASAQFWTGDLAGGLRSLEHAIRLRPDHALALARRGLALAKLRRYGDAIASLRQAAAVQPGFTEARRALGELLLTSGEDAAAKKQLQAVTEADPSDEFARFWLAAARHESLDAPPPSYVERLFDDYARTFEHHLVDVLQYRAPELVCEAVLEVAGSRACDWSVIDLGCGTGLCGSLIRRAARHLIGVDISAGMLEQARAKAVYDELRLGDVAQELARHTAAFDLALCTDVMIYLGNLEPLFGAAAGALRRGGLFAFTTEIHRGDGFALDRTGRYLHSRSYIETLARTYGFDVLRFEPIVGRYQSGEPDLHNLFVLKLKQGGVVPEGEAEK